MFQVISSWWSWFGFEALVLDISPPTSGLQAASREADGQRHVGSVKSWVLRGPMRKPCTWGRACCQNSVALGFWFETWERYNKKHSPKCTSKGLNGFPLDCCFLLWNVVVGSTKLFYGYMGRRVIISPVDSF